MAAFPPPDLATWGRAWGWKLEPTPHLNAVQSCLDARQPLAFFQDAGRTDWRPQGDERPEHFLWAEDWPLAAEVAAVIAVTDRLLPPPRELPILFYRPPSLALGIQGTVEASAGELLECIAQFLLGQQLSILSLTALAATAELKNHADLLDAAESLQIPLLTYPSAALSRLPAGVLSATASACTRAAMLAAGSSSVIAEAVDFGSFTLSLARRKAQASTP